MIPASTSRSLRRGASLLLVVALWVAVPRSAQAYIDPGTGGMMIQMLIAAVAAVGTIATTYWSRLRLMFVKKKPEAQIEPPPAAPPAAHDPE